MNGATYKMKVLSALAKVFADEEPVSSPECNLLTGLWGETISFQVAYTGDFFMRERLKVKVSSPLEQHIRIRKVLPVPVGKAANGIIDDNYIKNTSGMYPDLLRDLKDDSVDVITKKWNSLWIDVELTEDISGGKYPIKIELIKNDMVVCQAETNVTVYPVRLPAQKLIHTEWLHADCLADYYQVPVFSEKHWKIVENFVSLAVKRGVNMIMIPLFTSPLDTAIGWERTTTQLVEVKVVDGNYEFDFSKVKRWIDMLQRCGVEYFEMSHLFSQWGAVYAPKVVAEVNGKEEKIFGWHTPAVGEYTRFLEAFLPQLTEKLRQWGIAEQTYFHISDEPREEHLESYRAAKESLGNMLDGFQTFDALSSYEFYKHGLVSKPIPGNNQIETFLEHGLTDMWTYYCVGQYYEVSNRFMSMPSARTRIFGTQLFKYDIAGILHWGYNFYNSQFSYEHINPYEVTDAMGAFPAGDAFLVYPGENGMPEESLRMMVLYEALTDLRALRLLESLTSKEYVMELMESGLAEPITFKRYPKSEMYLIQLRNRVNREIAKRLL